MSLPRLLPLDRSARLGGACLAVTLAALSGVGACERFDGPPEPTLAGLTDGLLADASAPVIVDFSKPVKESSLTLRLIPYVVDSQGNLADEGGNPSGSLDAGLLFMHDPTNGDVGGGSTFAPDDTSLTITLAAPLPVGPRLLVLVEPGLSSVAGVTTNVRRRLPFGYEASLTCKAPSSIFRSGEYFFLAIVKVPIATQVKLFASIRLDPSSGAFVGQFTDAVRNPDPNRCPTPCASTEVCRLLPSPRCTVPSDPVGTVDEFSDFVPNDQAATGFSFTATGCVSDRSDGSVVFTTAPTDVQVTKPAVTLRNARLNGLFKPAGGVLRATGAFGADDVLLGTFPSGAAAGDLTARSLSAAEAPKGIPDPPASK